MLEDIIIAYKDKDSDLSVKVRDKDVVIDKMNTKLYQEVLASMSRNKKNIVSILITKTYYYMTSSQRSQILFECNDFLYFQQRWHLSPLTFSTSTFTPSVSSI